MKKTVRIALACAFCASLVFVGCQKDYSPDIDDLSGRVTALENLNLADRVNNLEASVKDLQADVTEINKAIEATNAEIENVKKNIEENYATKAELQKLAELAATKAELALAKEELLGALQANVDALTQQFTDADAKTNERIDALKKDLEAEILAVKTSLQDELKNQKAEVEAIEKALNEKIEAVDAELAKQVEAINAKLEKQEKEMIALIEATKTELQNKDAELAGKIATVETNLKNDLAAVKSELANAIEKGDKVLDDKIVALQNKMNEELAKLATKEEVAALKNELNTKIDGIKTDLQNQIAAAKKELQDEIDATNAALAQAVETLEQKIQDGDDYLEGLYNSLKQDLEDLKIENAAAHKAYDAAILALQNKDAELEAAIEQLGEDIAALEDELDQEIEDRKSADEDLQGQIDNLQDQIDNLDDKIDALEESLTEKIDDLEESLNEKIDNAVRELKAQIKINSDSLKTLDLKIVEKYNEVISRIQAAEGRLTTAESNIATLQMTVSGISTNIVEIKGDITALTGRVKTLEEKLGVVEKEISAITARVQSLVAVAPEREQMEAIRFNLGAIDTTVISMAFDVTPAEAAANITTESAKIFITESIARGEAKMDKDAEYKIMSVTPDATVAGRVWIKTAVSPKKSDNNRYWVSLQYTDKDEAGDVLINTVPVMATEGETQLMNASNLAWFYKNEQVTNTTVSEDAVAVKEGTLQLVLPVVNVDYTEWKEDSVFANIFANADIRINIAALPVNSTAKKAGFWTFADLAEYLGVPAATFAIAPAETGTPAAPAIVKSVAFEAREEGKVYDAPKIIENEEFEGMFDYAEKEGDLNVDLTISFGDDAYKNIEGMKQAVGLVNKYYYGYEPAKIVKGLVIGGEENNTLIDNAGVIYSIRVAKHSQTTAVLNQAAKVVVWDFKNFSYSQQDDPKNGIFANLTWDGAADQLDKINGVAATQIVEVNAEGTAGTTAVKGYNDEPIVATITKGDAKVTFSVAKALVAVADKKYQAQWLSNQLTNEAGVVYDDFAITTDFTVARRILDKEIDFGTIDNFAPSMLSNNLIDFAAITKAFETAEDSTAYYLGGTALTKADLRADFPASIDWTEGLSINGVKPVVLNSDNPALQTPYASWDAANEAKELEFRLAPATFKFGESYDLAWVLTAYGVKYSYTATINVQDCPFGLITDPLYVNAENVVNLTPMFIENNGGDMYKLPVIALHDYYKYVPVCAETANLYASYTVAAGEGISSPVSNLTYTDANGAVANVPANGVIPGQAHPSNERSLEKLFLDWKTYNGRELKVSAHMFIGSDANTEIDGSEDVNITVKVLPAIKSFNGGSIKVNHEIKPGEDQIINLWAGMTAKANTYPTTFRALTNADEIAAFKANIINREAATLEEAMQNNIVAYGQEVIFPENLEGVTATLGGATYELDHNVFSIVDGQLIIDKDNGNFTDNLIIKVPVKMYFWYDRDHKDAYESTVTVTIKKDK